jgi:2-polyprenyl-3-methyl-5-hydroxy-6-metoxy-1,4-benzoquinol methylase
VSVGHGIPLEGCTFSFALEGDGRGVESLGDGPFDWMRTLLMASVCPICSSRDTEEFLEVLQIPVHCNLLWEAREEAEAVSRGDMHLVFCSGCGHIYNSAFRPELMEYGPSYENSLHWSPRFRQYAHHTAASLVDRYGLRDKEIIEIGCGNGDFLELLCELGDNRGIGFDPSFSPEEGSKRAERRARIIRDFYSEDYGEHRADLICCRHVLEHLPDPAGFLSMLRHVIGDEVSTRLFFEVPNALAILRDHAIWDITYEHRSYFTSNSLHHVFAACGFEVQSLCETYDGQFLTIEALPGVAPGRTCAEAGDDSEVLAGLVAAFADVYCGKLETWERRLERIGNAGWRAVVWGAGTKAAMLLNLLRAQDRVEYVVDVNPRKQGMYVAGTGQEIVAPGFLPRYQPNVVIIVNPIYKDEIMTLAQTLGLTTEFMVAQ